MPRLTQATAKDAIEYNRNRIYWLPEQYKAIGYYFRISPAVRRTLLQVLDYLKDKEIIFGKNNRYLFFLDNKRLTNRVRRQQNTNASTARYMNMLCAMGFFTKIPQSKEDPDKLIQVNRNFLENQPEKQHPINVYSYRRYTDKELKRIDDRADQLRAAGVRVSNISYNMLMSNGCEEIAKEVYPTNNKSAPEKKQREYAYLEQCLDLLIDSQGYATRGQLRDNLSGAGMMDQEIDRLLQIFKEHLKDQYAYKRPTNQQRQQFNLKDNKYIYTRKD